MLGVACRTAPTDLTELREQVRTDYPTVRQISTAALTADVILVDVRTPAEYAVSHLPGARSGLTDLPPTSAIVVYCSVGYRSAQSAQQLQAAGYTHVANLDGGIFQWANEGRPLAGSPKVHPYNHHWARYLKPELRAPLP